MSNNCKGFWSAKHGLGEWTTDDQLEVAARVAEIRQQKEAAELAAYEAQEPNMTPIATVPFRDYFRHGFQPGSFS